VPALHRFRYGLPASVSSRARHRCIRPALQKSTRAGSPHGDRALSNSVATPGQRAVPDEAVGACSRSCRTSKTVPRGSAAAARRATVSDPDVALLSSPKLRRARQPPHLARPARAAIRHLRIHRSVLQPPAPTLDPQDALPGQLRTATTLSARRLRAMARTRQNQHQQQTPRCHANRDRSTPAPNRAARTIAFAESDRPGGREPEMPLP
jgi:hypothetical protein